MLFAAAEAAHAAVEKKQVAPFDHVRDSHEIHVFDNLHIHLPEPVTKFHLILALSALLVGVLVIWVANKIASGEPPKGRLWNLIESLLLFIRDKVARPSLGEHDADKYMPFLTTLFLFIFANNLFGMLPFLGSPTAHIYVTGALAFVSFLVIHTSGIIENGFGHYLKSFIPHIEVDNAAIKYGMIAMMAPLEYMTAFIRAIILAVRLFANMLAGHTVLFVILFFIQLVANPEYQIDIAKGNEGWMYWLVAPFSVLMVTALSLLELFIAGLQAFIFTFLTAIFISLAKHPAH